MNTMIPLYGPEDLRRLDNRIRFTRCLCWALGLAALAVCVTLCCLTTTGSAGRLELCCIAVWTLAGWVVLYLRRVVLAEGRYERLHAEMLNQGLAEAEALRGRVTVTAEKLHILRSIRITIVTLEDADGTHRLKVCRSRVKKLQAAGDELTLCLVNGYIAGYSL